MCIVVVTEGLHMKIGLQVCTESKVGVLVCSSSRGRLRLSLHLSHSYWSRSISLETIGMPNSAFLLAPAKSPAAASAGMQSRPIEGLQMLESADPIR